MFDTYFGCYVIAWVYHAAMYWVAMVIMRANRWHAVWMSSLVSVPAAVFAMSSVDDAFSGSILDHWVLPISMLVAMMVVGTFFYWLYVDRFLIAPARPGEKRGYFYSLLNAGSPPFPFMQMTMLGNMPPVSIIFLPLFNLIVGFSVLTAQWLRTRKDQ